MELSDQFIIAHTTRRLVAIVVDAVTDVVELSGQKAIAGEKILPGLEYIQGVVKLEDELILIHDLDTFLSIDEEKALDDALLADH